LFSSVKEICSQITKVVEIVPHNLIVPASSSRKIRIAAGHFDQN